MNRMAEAVADGYVVMTRNLIRLRRVPDLVVFTMVQPVVLVLLFAYVFGGAISVPGVPYREFLLPGILVQCGLWGSAITTIGIVDDLQKGVVERFRSLPMAPSAVILGRAASDLVNTLLSIAVTCVCGLLIGWRVRTGPVEFLGAMALLLLFVFAFTWVAATIGLWIRSPQVAQSVGTLWLFPAAFLSSAFVPIGTLPGWLRPVAEVNPVSAATFALRRLLGNGDPSAASAGPAGAHPVALTVGWSIALLVLFVPLAGWRYRRAAPR